MMKNRNILLIPLFIILFISVIFVPEMFSGAIAKLRINEVMTSNKNTITDIFGNYSDYIEIYNENGYDIDLKGYYLSDDLDETKKWMFPGGVIKAFSYIVVYASGKDGIYSDELHTNFKLSSSGTKVILSDNTGKVISKISVPKSDKDIPYGLKDGKYTFLEIGTPGQNNADIINSSTYLMSKFALKEIMINEVGAVNEEFIELKNRTDHEIDLQNYILTDGKTTTSLSGIIKPNDYVVYYGNTKNKETNKKYLDFNINKSNEKIALYYNNVKMDEIIVGKLTSNTSVGRDSNEDKVYYSDITVGKDNSSVSYLGYSEMPEFNIDGGYVDKNTLVELKTNDGGTIYYTLDGSMPTTKSTKYTGKIKIDKTKVVKAINVKEGYLSSDIIARTYFVNVKHSLPIVSISTNPNLLFGSESGILVKGNYASYSYPYYGANWWNGLERDINFELYENNGDLSLDFMAITRVFGGWSRGEAQKSLAIMLKKEIGKQEITYPFFSKDNSLDRFVLRSGGQDFGYIKIKDAFMQQVIANQVDLDYQDYFPVVVYINGEYYGLYNIREKIDVEYVTRHLNVSKEDITFIEGNSTVHAGSYQDYQDLLTYVTTHDLNDEEAYKYVDSQVDLQELCNYWVTEVFFGQQDPLNIKYYKTKEGKWRWILYDLDQSLNSYYNVVWDLPFKPYASGQSYAMNTTLMSRLITSTKFREMYIKTWSDMLKTTFKPDRMNGILDRMVNEIKPEMSMHIARWSSPIYDTGWYQLNSYNEWTNNINTVKYRLKTRYNVVVNNIKSGLGLTSSEYKKYFGDL